MAGYIDCKLFSLSRVAVSDIIMFTESATPHSYIYSAFLLHGWFVQLVYIVVHSSCLSSVFFPNTQKYKRIEYATECMTSVLQRGFLQ